MNNDHGNVVHKLTHDGAEIKLYEICGFNWNPGTDELLTVDDDKIAECVRMCWTQCKGSFKAYIPTCFPLDFSVFLLIVNPCSKARTSPIVRYLREFKDRHHAGGAQWVRGSVQRRRLSNTPLPPT